MGASNNGTKCASARTIPLAETDNCNVVSCPPGEQDLLGKGCFFSFFSWLRCRSMGSLDFLFCCLWQRQQEKDKVNSITTPTLNYTYVFFWPSAGHLQDSPFLSCPRSKLADAENKGEECTDYLLRALLLNDVEECYRWQSNCPASKLNITI